MCLTSTEWRFSRSKGSDVQFTRRGSAELEPDRVRYYGELDGGNVGRPAGCGARDMAGTTPTVRPGYVELSCH